MPEHDYFNGENFVTFDLIEIDDEKREVTVAVSDTGRISVKTFDLLFDGTLLPTATENLKNYGNFHPFSYAKALKLLP
mgnify:CR=1 FL=1